MVNGLLASEHRHADYTDLYGFHGLGSWVTEGHRGSQRVTEGHRGSQRVTEEEVSIGLWY